MIRSIASADSAAAANLKMEFQHMDAKKVAMVGISLAFGPTGCVTNKVPDLAYVEASDVIDSLKDELAEVAKNPIDKQVLVPPDSCGVEKDGHKMVHVTIGSFSLEGSSVGLY